MLASLLTLILTLAILGFALWLVFRFVPMPEPMRTAIMVIVVLVILIWLVRLAFVPSLRWP